MKTAENEVDQHQKLQDLHQQCRDWMAGTKDKLAVCAEASGDRQALQNRLDKVEVGGEMSVFSFVGATVGVS